MSKWTNKEIAEKLMSEGLGYMIQHYLSANSIEDLVLAGKWDKCSKLLREIEQYLEPYLEDE